MSQADTGATSGLVNATHQLGGTLGLSILVVIFARPGQSALPVKSILAEQISMTLQGAAVMALLGLVVTLFFIVRSQHAPSSRRISAGMAKLQLIRIFDPRRETFHLF